jgi:cyclohexanone monooxygenase
VSSNGYAMLGDLPDRLALATPSEERERIYRQYWDKGGPALPRAFKDIVSNRQANDTACEFVRNRIREIVRNPKTAELLCPKTYAIGTKRICVDTDYYATYNRDNVTLVDVKSAPIEEITSTGLRTRDAAWDLDVIIFATGFDALTGTLMKIDVRGRNGQSLATKWAQGPRTYLGLAIAGFPNLLTVTGPGSPSVFSNVITSIEQHVEWIADCLDYLRKRGLTVIEATQSAEDDWGRHVVALGNGTLYPETNSWYVGANVPGKPRAFLPYIGGVGNYRRKCDEVAARGYEGFRLSGGRSGAAAA